MSSVKVAILSPIQIILNGKIESASSVSYWIIFHTNFPDDAVPGWAYLISSMLDRCTQTEPLTNK